jgi:predicted DNA binding CopG/RHH family protein
MSRKLPAFNSDEEAETFLDRGDLSDFIARDRLKPLTFEFSPKEKTVSMRMPEALLDAVKAAAGREGMPYQRFIRLTLEREVGHAAPPARTRRRKAG